MYARDFEYDGQSLSDYNCIVCDFDGSSGAMFASAGSSITFNKATRNFGRSNILTGIQYDECFTATFDICKDPDNILSDEEMYFTSDEYRDLVRWLNRGSFNKFRILFEDYDIDVDPFYFNASFNVEKIKIGEKVCGLRLTMETDKPYAYGDEEISTFSVTTANFATSCFVKVVSDDIGDIYPVVHIVCKSAGDLKIINSAMGTITIIQDCVSGEEITIDGNILMVKTTSSKNVWSRFNYVFPQLTNSLNRRVNELKFSIPCEVTVSYVPIIKETV